MGCVYLCEHSKYKVGGWVHINGWIGHMLSLDVRDVWDVDLCELSEFKVGGWAHINRW